MASTGGGSGNAKEEDGVSLFRVATVSVVSTVVVVAAFKNRTKLLRAARSVISVCTSGVGFVASTGKELLLYRTKRHRWDAALNSLDEYLTVSGVKEEIQKATSSDRLLGNIGLLMEVQTQLPPRNEEAGLSLGTKSLPTMEEATRYMRYATAVYGSHQIASVEMEVDGYVKHSSSQTIEEIVCSHVMLKNPKDVLVADMEYGGSMDCLRHMVIVDHEHKVLVLAVRGTFSVSEVIHDLGGYSEPFCGGEAHAGIAAMAKAVWSKAEESVGKYVDDLPEDYEIILTGHSLGAAVACLMTIMAFQDKLLPPQRKIRCFAYAPPPCFYPLSAAEDAVSCITAYVNNYDCVPSLSVNAFRHLFAVLVELDDVTRHLPYMKRAQVRWRYAKPPSNMVEAVRVARRKPLSEKKGAAPLAVPASAVVWLKDDEEFPLILDPIQMANLGIYVHPAIMMDHQAGPYELALKRFARYH